MELLDCYRLLGLTPHATVAEVKASYRSLARRLHPDLNPGLSHDRFVRLHQAYQVLLEVVPNSATPASRLDPDLSQPPVPTTAPPPRTTKTTRTNSPEQAPRTATKTGPPSSPPGASSAGTSQASSGFRHHPQLSPFERQLKSQAYYRLQKLLGQGKFAHAIALVEGLSQRLSVDIEVHQWQAVTYQRVARQSIKQGEFRKGRIYLNKALRTDPHNHSLRQEVEQDFRRLQRQVRQRSSHRVSP